ncbi:hypothetical protein BH10CYA1_BH10CYA1_32750 [soil metagenome]
MQQAARHNPFRAAPFPTVATTKTTTIRPATTNRKTEKRSINVNQSNIMNKFNPATDNVPTELTAKSFIGDILIALGFATRAQVDNALAIQTQERDARTEEEKLANKKTRFTGEILVDDKVCTQEQIDYAMDVQTHLRK